MGTLSGNPLRWVNFAAVLGVGTAMLFLPGCGEDRKAEAPKAKASGPAEGARPTVETVSVVPERVTKETSLKARVEMSGAAGSDGRTLRYQWLKNGNPIAGESASALGSSAFKKGDLIAVRVSSGEGGQSKESVSVRVQNTPPRMVMVWVTPVGLTRAGEAEANARAVDADGETVSFRYQWLRNGIEIPGATESKMSLAEVSKKDKISVHVTPFDGETEGMPSSSRAMEILNTPPRISSTPPASVSGGTYSYQVTAHDPDKDPLSFALAKAPAGMTIDGKGAITWAIGEGGTGTHAVEVVVTDADGAKATQAFTVTVSVSEKQP